MGVGDHDRVDVRGRQADRSEVPEDAPAVRPHRSACAGLDQDAPASGFDQQRVEVERHVVGGQEGLLQRRAQFHLRRIARIDARRAANEAVAQHGRADRAHTEAVVAGIAAPGRRRLGLHRRAAGDDRSRGARHGGEHHGTPVESDCSHRKVLPAIGARPRAARAWNGPLPSRPVAHMAMERP